MRSARGPVGLLGFAHGRADRATLLEACVLVGGMGVAPGSSSGQGTPMRRSHPIQPSRRGRPGWVWVTENTKAGPSDER